jgi:transcriptional regulator with GAF, ATPase, and Fis domain
MERDHILAVLKKTNGKIWGPGAAAEMLKIPPSTLKSKMKKLGITRAYTL